MFCSSDCLSWTAPHAVGAGGAGPAAAGTGCAPASVGACAAAAARSAAAATSAGASAGFDQVKNKRFIRALSPNGSFVLQAASLGQQGQQQVPQPKTGPRCKTRFDPVVRALECAETETSPSKDGGSGVQGGGPALISSGLNDNNESLNQTRGSSGFDFRSGRN